MKQSETKQNKIKLDKQKPNQIQWKSKIQKVKIK